MATYNFGIAALMPSDVQSHVLGFASQRSATTASLLEVWEGPDSTDCQFAVRVDGDVIMGDPRVPADVATTAVRGFLSIRTCAGPPTGTPADAGTAAGQAPMVYDRTNHALYIYNGSWRSVAVT